MKRHYYIADELDELAAVQRELRQQGVSNPQIHVLSWDDAEVKRRELHEVEAVLKKDVVHSMVRGALIGAAVAIVVLVGAWLTGMTATAAGWAPFIFLTIVILGFCTWEGGFFGIQQPHYQFKRFQQDLDMGKHIFFVDLYPEQEALMARVVEQHPRLDHAGDDESTPSWVVQLQNRWHNFVEAMP
jgi:hypothetical protein